MQKTNNERLQTIASAMQELNSHLVYVGGAMAGAYATDPPLKNCSVRSIFRMTMTPSLQSYVVGYIMATW